MAFEQFPKRGQTRCVPEPCNQNQLESVKHMKTWHVNHRCRFTVVTSPEADRQASGSKTHVSNPEALEEKGRPSRS